MAYPIGSSGTRYGNVSGLPQSTIDQARTDDQKTNYRQKATACVLADQRLPWEPMIRITSLLTSIMGCRFIQDTELWHAQQTGQMVFDDSAMLARNKLVEARKAYPRPRNQPWFGLNSQVSLTSPEALVCVHYILQVQKWLQDSATVLYSAFRSQQLQPHCN